MCHYTLCNPLMKINCLGFSARWKWLAVYWLSCFTRPISFQTASTLCIRTLHGLEYCLLPLFI